jgi:hypothetical protein
MLKEGDLVRFKTWEELCDEYGEDPSGKVYLPNGRALLKKRLGDILGSAAYLDKLTIDNMWIVKPGSRPWFPELFKKFEPIDEAMLKIRKEIWQQ